MIIFLLFGIAIASFLFYGVVGADKTWLLAPAFVLNFALVTIALFRRVREQRTENRERISEVRGQSSVISLPSSGLLWILFIAFGVFVISKATVPFESKLVTLFIGGVVGAFIVWGGERMTVLLPRYIERIGWAVVVAVVAVGALLIFWQ